MIHSPPAKLLQPLIPRSTDLTAWLQELYAEPPIEDVSNDDILAEVNS